MFGLLSKRKGILLNKIYLSHEIYFLNMKMKKLFKIYKHRKKLRKIKIIITIKAIKVIFFFSLFFKSKKVNNL